MLRIFTHIYLNDQLVMEALSALEGGALAGSEELLRSSTDKGGHADLAAGPVQAGGKFGASNASELRSTRTDTPEARLLRLVNLLESAEQLPLFDASTDDAGWFESRRGTLFEAHGNVEISVMSALEKPVKDMEAVMAIAEAVGLQDPFESIKQDVERIEKIAKVSEARPVRFVFSLGGAESCRAVGELEREHLRVPTNQLTGEFTIFAKVAGFIPKGEVYDLTSVVGDILDLGQAASRRQRRASKRRPAKGSAKLTHDERFTVKGPALKITPYAIVN